jgi:Putative metal-binding motif/FG-GAP repeat
MRLLFLFACEGRDSAYEEAPVTTDADTADSAGDSGDTSSHTAETDTTTDTAPPDVDGDGWPADEDCDDTNAYIHPSAGEVCANSIDDDCDGRVDERCESLAGDLDITGADAMFVTTIEGARLGSHVGAVGDMSGDSLPDIALVSGDYGVQDTGDFGALYVLSADADGVFDVSGSALAEYHGEEWEAQLGDDGLFGLGDVTGDGLDDMGVITTDGTGTWIVPGPAGGGGPISTFAYEVQEEGAWTGNRPLGAGDLTGDGLRDVIIGGPGWSATRGAVAIVPGPITGDVTLDAETLSIQGESTSYCVGKHGSTPGDIDGDGLDDLVIGGSWCGDPGGANRYSWFVPGPITDSASVWDVGTVLTAFVATASGPAGDTDGDGYLEFWTTVYDSDWPEEAGTYIMGAPGPEGAAIVDVAKARVFSSVEDDYFFNAAAGPGDVNGDGFDDLLLGNPNSSLVEEDAGSAWLGYGPFVGAVDLATTGATFRGATGNTFLGISVAGPGDTDGDGFADILIGAADHNDPETGTVWLFRGR